MKLDKTQDNFKDLNSLNLDTSWVYCTNNGAERYPTSQSINGSVERTGYSQESV
jgi:hypothetical protein